MKRPKIHIVWLLLFAFAAIARAQPGVSLPLDGYYRPGKFFPVKVESDREVSVEVKADAVSSRGRGRSLVLPAMSLSRVPGVVTVTINGKELAFPIRPLEANQSLWVRLGHAPTVKPFSNNSVMVAVPGGVTALGMAYESADFIQITADQRPAVAASPLAILGKTFVLDHDLIGPIPDIEPPRGPSSSLDDPRPYAVPFVPARGIGLRRSTWLMLALFSILVLAISLRQSRHVWAAIGLLSLAAVGYCTYGMCTTSPVSSVQADIFFSEGRDHFCDEWEILGSLADTDYTLSTGHLAYWPIFGGQAAELRMVIEVEPKDWKYHFHLPPQGRIAFVYRREVKVATESNTVNPGSGGLFRDLMRSWYLRPGETLSYRSLVLNSHQVESYWIPPTK